MREATAVFIAGDAGDDLPLLHEAADEGSHAGEMPRAFLTCARRASARHSYRLFQTRSSRSSERHADLVPSFVTGAVSFENQGKPGMLRNVGLPAYVRRHRKRTPGGCRYRPGSEHLGHLIAWSIQMGLANRARRSRCRSITRWSRLARRCEMRMKLEAPASRKPSVKLRPLDLRRLAGR